MQWTHGHRGRVLCICDGNVLRIGVHTTVQGSKGRRNFVRMCSESWHPGTIEQGLQHLGGLLAWVRVHQPACTRCSIPESPMCFPEPSDSPAADMESVDTEKLKAEKQAIVRTRFEQAQGAARFVSCFGSRVANLPPALPCAT